MRTLKAGLLTAAGVAVGILTLRTVRKRRGEMAAEEDPATAVRTETRAAAEHATAAASHALVAGKTALEVVETNVDERRTTAADDGNETEPSPPVRRLRRVGKGWVRR